MSRAILLLRPEPGASQSAERARAMGLEPVVAPIFSILPVAWDAPEPDAFDAVLLTSANAARQGGAGLAHYTHLPCFGVGEATAAAARAAGFADVRTGPSDIDGLLDEIARRAERRLLHLCGREHVAAERAGLAITRVPVYAADAVERLPDDAAAALEKGALALLHSPRAGMSFANLVDDAGISRDRVRIAAISAAAADAAGRGWARMAVADAPRDAALLSLAARLPGL